VKVGVDLLVHPCQMHLQCKFGDRRSVSCRDNAHSVAGCCSGQVVPYFSRDVRLCGVVLSGIAGGRCACIEVKVTIHAGWKCNAKPIGLYALIT